MNAIIRCRDDNHKWIMFSKITLLVRPVWPCIKFGQVQNFVNLVKYQIWYITKCGTLSKLKLHLIQYAPKFGYMYKNLVLYQIRPRIKFDHVQNSLTEHIWLSPKHDLPLKFGHAQNYPFIRIISSLPPYIDFSPFNKSIPNPQQTAMKL